MERTLRGSSVPQDGRLRCREMSGKHWWVLGGVGGGGGSGNAIQVPPLLSQDDVLLPVPHRTQNGSHMLQTKEMDCRPDEGGSDAVLGWFSAGSSIKEALKQPTNKLAS